ncbi:hypothetical protein MSG28_008036 [Choristoneura fumiferana]|uniref:Uncharacterized protein n=1 Tax=Choristoneura fumiferana TaxID=7141 RepID=A0ACC0J9T7_CHOFU|nr:hypothetical protein MSG28_008036 [Choristoneura fumiferana]
MTGVLKFDIHRTGMLAALPYLVMWICSIVFGWICDKIVKRKWMTVTNARKTFTTIVFIVTNLVYVAWASGDEQWWNSSSQDPRRRQKTEAGDSSRSVNAEVIL